MKEKMKTKLFLVLTAVLAVITVACAQSDKKLATLTMKSSVVCGQCKDRIEAGLAYEKGVKDVSVDLEKKDVTVKYNPEKTTPAAIRQALSKIGYDADDVKADPKAYEKLPACCKKDASSH